MLYHVWVLHSFLWLNNIPLYGYSTFIYLWVEHLGYFNFLTIMYDTAMNIHVQVFVCIYVFIYLEYAYLGMKLMGMYTQYICY